MVSNVEYRDLKGLWKMTSFLNVLGSDACVCFRRMEMHISPCTSHASHSDSALNVPIVPLPL